MRNGRWLLMVSFLVLLLSIFSCEGEDSIIGDGNTGPQGGCFVECVDDEGQHTFGCNVFSNTKNGDSYTANTSACESWRENACGSASLAQSNYDGGCACEADCAPSWWEG